MKNIVVKKTTLHDKEHHSFTPYQTCEEMFHLMFVLSKQPFLKNDQKDFKLDKSVVNTSIRGL